MSNYWKQKLDDAIDARREEIVEVRRNVCGLLSLHMDPSRPTGTVGVRSGILTANCAEIEIRIHGRGAHAARPHQWSSLCQ